MRISWTQKAIVNLDSAVEYIATDRPAAASRVAQKICNSVHHPSRGRPGRVAGTRELVISGLPYIVVYAEHDSMVVILRVMHTSLKWPKHF